MLEKGASGSKRGAPTAANVLEWKLDNERRGGIRLSFPTILRHPASGKAVRSGGLMISVPFQFLLWEFGSAGEWPGFGVHIAHVLLVLRPTYRISAPTAADLL